MSGLTHVSLWRENSAFSGELRSTIPLSGTSNSWNAGNPSAIAPDAVNEFGATKALFCFTGKFCCPMMRLMKLIP